MADQRTRLSAPVAHGAAALVLALRFRAPRPGRSRCRGGGRHDGLLTVDDVEGVEIYSSHLTTPLELHVPQDACGVIALWTHPGRGRPHTWRRVAVGALLAGMILFLY